MLRNGAAVPFLDSLNSVLIQLIEVHTHNKFATSPAAED